MSSDESTPITTIDYEQEAFGCLMRSREADGAATKTILIAEAQVWALLNQSRVAALRGEIDLMRLGKGR